MGKNHSAYCLESCPIGRVAAQKFVAESDSVFDAVIDMEYFVDGCLEGGCSYEKERLEYDAKQDK